jgi:hypothetical protein
MKRFIKWLTSKTSARKASPDPAPPPGAANLRSTGGHTVRRTAKLRQSVYVDLDPHVEGRVENNGPGKNVLIRNKFLREDSGTHETLKILDDSIIDTDEEEGIDPYNTGQFDRSKNWDRRTK